MDHNPSPELFRAVVREDFNAFLDKAFLEYEGKRLQENWHTEAICHQLMRCVKGERKRLIITLPPRSLKSFMVSTALPAWLMGHNPRMRIITVSYTQELAAKFSRDQRLIMQQPWYKTLFPNAGLNPRKCNETEFETKAGGFRLATSVGGTLTGRGADLIIIDDPMKPQDAMSDAKRKSIHEWVDSTLLSRLDSKKDGVIILVMQRVHVDDTADYLMRKGWEILNLPAIAPYDMTFPLGNGKEHLFCQGEALHPAREPLEVLAQLKEELGIFTFTTQYLQQPTPMEGNYLKKEWFRPYNIPLPPGGRIVQSWDTALTCETTSDWSVCTTWYMVNKTYYLIDVYRQRLDFPALKRKVVELKQKFNAHSVLIEESIPGLSLIQQLRSEGTSVKGIKPQGSKEERMMAASLFIESGAALFPKEAPWLDELMAELLAFPAGRHDDQVDSISQFLNWAHERSKHTFSQHSF